MIRLITLHEANKWDNPQQDTEICINVERIVCIRRAGFDDGRVTQIETSPCHYFVRESVEEVRSLIYSHRDRINNYNH